MVVLRLSPSGGLRAAREGAKKGRGAWTFGSKERQEFAEFYTAEASAAASAARQTGSSTATLYGLACTAPVKYVGHAAITRDIENLAAAVRANRVEDVFMTAVSPATLQILPNEYYKTPRNIRGRSQRRSATNTKPSSMLASFSRSMTRRSSTSMIGGSP